MSEPFSLRAFSGIEAPLKTNLLIKILYLLLSSYEKLLYFLVTMYMKSSDSIHSRSVIYIYLLKVLYDDFSESYNYTY